VVDFFFEYVDEDVFGCDFGGFVVVACDLVGFFESFGWQCVQVGVHSFFNVFHVGSDLVISGVFREFLFRVKVLFLQEIQPVVYGA